jgi:hypothetical protein
MPDAVSDPPTTFAAAEQKFKTFLGSNGYSETICWAEREDVVVDRKGRLFARERNPRAAERADTRYSDGIKGKRGIALRALGATQTETLALVFVPKNELEAQFALMGRGLKLSCPASKTEILGVKNPFVWFILRLRYGNRSKMLWL